METGSPEHTELRRVAETLVRCSRDLEPLLEAVRRGQRAGKPPWDLRYGEYDQFLSSFRTTLARVDERLGDSDYLAELPDLALQRKIASQPKRPLRKKTWGRLKFQLLPVAFDESMMTPEVISAAKDYDAQRIINVRRCGDFDVYWTNRLVYLMKRKGVLEVLPIADWHNNAMNVASVSWDGRYVWLSGAINRVVVLDSKTWKLHEVDGLPSHDSIHVLGYETGKAIAVGNVGRDFRAWCARVTLTMPDGDDSLPRFKNEVFHEARKKFVVGEYKSYLDDKSNQLAFRCRWISNYETPDGRRLVAICRPGYPLLVEPRTLELSTLRNIVTGSHEHGDCFYSFRGNTVAVYGGKAVLHQAGRSSRQLGARGFRYVPFEGWLYSFGFNGIWDRINLETFEVENLVPTMLPGLYESCGVGESAHYGLVGFGARTVEQGELLFSVSIKPADFKPRP